ncbi:hypothetical protein [Fluviicola taffensis]|uniref:Uncharacterized protein n=1 Tax=Fluviicola taffensis (strain DSM 16823 / NCIMB 13979 / RW262) TaxID=755732 RepID=F2IEX9_FLUTR|nr:hypothetical protein [Fluviicola taffensis]AEA42444.1 hypothetical protein Fluta_0438 [Fluviicola taffensis DSM 16823]
MKKKLLLKSISWFVSLLFLGTTGIYAQSAYPVSLSSPLDYDTIVETEPTFNWQTNLSAIQTDPRCSQRFVLCELETDQLKGDAIAINTPVLVLEDYQNSMYSYSSSSTPLEEGHTYVWQVSVLFNGIIMDQSEPYQFTILKPKDPLPSFYPVAFNSNGQTYLATNQKIGLVTDEIGELKLTVQIYKNGRLIKVADLKDLKKEGDDTDNTESKKPTSGKRFLILDLKELELESGYYSVVWAPKSKKNFMFNFKID